MPVWVIDGNNVYGSRPDGWWRDRAGAAARLVAQVRTWQATAGDPVVVVLDDAPAGGDDRPEGSGDARVEVLVAGRRGRDAADDVVVEVAASRHRAGQHVRVVTSDRGLVARLPPAVEVETAGAFLRRLAGGPDLPR